ncbi:MAG: hypothetical protein WC529_01060 [Candidatus Margulisiibacteriota bacterium]
MVEHIVWKYSLRAGKPFFPNGRDIPIRNFQNTFRQLLGKINVSLKIIRDYGLADRVMLGRQPVTAVKELAVYLYDNTISPLLFANALHAIAQKAKELDGHVVQVQLRNLRRDHLADMIRAGAATEDQFGRNSAYFENLPSPGRLQLLEKLGVITLRPGHQLPADRANQPAPDRRPPIERIDWEKRQIELFEPDEKD